MKKRLLFVLTDGFADWEAAFLAAALRGGTLPARAGSCGTCYATPDGAAVRSIGGLRVQPDRDTASLPDDCAGVVLVGGLGWRSEAAERVVPLVEEARRRALPIGAICDACSFLAAHGFLNEVRHTGNTVETLRERGGDRYCGAARFVERQAVRDGGVLTANGTGCLEFAREWLLELGDEPAEAVEAWYAFFKQGFYRD